MWCVKHAYLAFSGWCWVESRVKNEGSHQLLIKPWLSKVNCDTSYCLASWIITRDSNLASRKSDSLQAGFWAVYPGWTGAAGCGSKLHFHGWSGRRLSVRSVSQEYKSLIWGQTSYTLRLPLAWLNPFPPTFVFLGKITVTTNSLWCAFFLTAEHSSWISVWVPLKFQVGTGCFL